MYRPINSPYKLQFSSLRVNPTFVLGDQSPLTSGFSSCKSFTQDSALDFPRLDSSKKKLTPRSGSVTSASSAIVNFPIPNLLAVLTGSALAAYQVEQDSSKSPLQQFQIQSLQARYVRLLGLVGRLQPIVSVDDHISSPCRKDREGEEVFGL